MEIKFTNKASFSVNPINNDMVIVLYQETPILDPNTAVIDGTEIVEVGRFVLTINFAKNFIKTMSEHFNITVRDIQGLNVNNTEELK